MMQLRNRQLLLSLLVASAPNPVRAHGDMTVLLLLAAQIVLVGIFVFFLSAWRNWRERILLSVFFFAPLLLAWLFTAQTPYTENRGWITALNLGAPIAGWVIGSHVVRIRRGNAA